MFWNLRNYFERNDEESLLSYSGFGEKHLTDCQFQIYHNYLISLDVSLQRINNDKQEKPS